MISPIAIILTVVLLVIFFLRRKTLMRRNVVTASVLLVLGLGGLLVNDFVSTRDLVWIPVMLLSGVVLVAGDLVSWSVFRSSHLAHKQWLQLLSLICCGLMLMNTLGTLAFWFLSHLSD
jgi:hypothetical protein